MFDVISKRVVQYQQNQPYSMQLQTKALYNLIHFNLKQGNDLDCEPWQKQDLESLSENELFSEIHLGQLVQSHFHDCLCSTKFLY